MIGVLILLSCSFSICFTDSTVVTLSNTKLPIDSRGESLITGEASSLYFGGSWYFYFNNWGGCRAVDCCGSPLGCAACCFNPPSPKYPDACVFANNHTVVGYRTSDFVSWEFLGVVLPLGSRHSGIEYRPHVVFNTRTGLFVMWYVDIWPNGQWAYAVATAVKPEGPFVTVSNDVKMATPCKLGDFDILVDPGGKAWHVRTGFAVEELNADFLGVTGKFYRFETPGYCEGPVFFERLGVYYIIVGGGCCGCRGGTNMLVYTAVSPLGPYTLRGDVGSNQTAPYDRHSPYNFVTRAQGSHLFVVPSGRKGESSYVWFGNQWVSNPARWPAINHDLLYFYPLQFARDGNVSQVENVSEVKFLLGLELENN